MIRAAKISDFDACYRIASQHFKRYPTLTADKTAVMHLFRECASGARNFAFVSEVDGEIVGCLLAISYDHIWAQKQSSSVLLWSCEKSSDGIRLLRKYRQWLDSRPAIRRGGFQFDIDIDARIYGALERCGFLRNGGCFLRDKGVL